MKKVKVTRKWLNDFADSIYNPKTKQFLRLCEGYLTNGPDPTNTERKMHCGLGELYFALTGKHAGSNVNEYGVVCAVFNASTLSGAEEKAELETIEKLKKLKLDKNIIEQLCNQVKRIDNGFVEKEEQFKNLLNDIPAENDDGCGHSAKDGISEDGYVEEKACTLQQFRARSRRVANQIRKAAKLLPE